MASYRNYFRLLVTSVLNHSTLEFRDFQIGHPAVEAMIDRRIFER